MKFIESLERRKLFTADPVFELTSKGTLIVHGTSDGDSIVAFFPSSKPSLRVVMTSSLQQDQYQELSHTYQARLSVIKRIRFEAGDGPDYMNLEGGDRLTRPATILGGAGNDQIDWSSAAPVSVDGSDGNDRVGTLRVIDATAKKNRDVVNAALAKDQGAIDTILGGNGDDTLNGNGNDHLDGGAGSDVAMLVSGQDGIDVPDERADAIAHDYYARIDLVSVESTDGFGASVIS